MRADKWSLLLLGFLALILAAAPARAQTVTSVTVAPATMIGNSNQTAAGMVTISQPAPEPGGVNSILGATTLDNQATSALIIQPGNVNIPAGGTSASFLVLPNATVGMATAFNVVAFLGQSAASTTVTLQPHQLSLSISPASLLSFSFAEAGGTLRVSAPLLNRLNFVLEADPEGQVAFKSADGQSFTLFAEIPAGSDVGTFKIIPGNAVAQNTVVTVTAGLALANLVASATVTLTPPQVSLSVAPSSLFGPGETTMGTLSLSTSHRGPLNFTLVADPPALISLTPFSLFLTTAGETGPFTVTQTAAVLQATPVTISALLFGTPLASTQVTLFPLSCLTNPTLPECTPPPPPGGEPPPLKRRITVLIVGGPQDSKVVASDELVTVQIPLGARFDIKFEKEQEPQADTFEDATAFFNLVQPAQVEQTDLAALALFATSVVLEFDPASPATTKFFQAVHLGEVGLDVNPADPSVPSVQLRLLVYQAQQLAGDPHNLDSSFYVLAHRHGVLPQFIKAQVARESGFNPFAWRYEPLNLEVGDLNVSRGDNLRQFQTADKPYGFYRLGTSADELNHTDLTADNKDDCSPLPDPDKRLTGLLCFGLTLGSKVIPEDINVRTEASPPLVIPERDINGDIIIDPNTGQPRTRGFLFTDVFVSARDILDFNDSRHNWKANVLPQESPEVRKAEINRRVSLLTFTAQTPLAASYGLLQITYVTAIDERKWPGTTQQVGNATIGQNPSFLFDTEDNINAGGGSLGLGITKVRNDYRRVNKQSGFTGTNIASEQALKQFFRNAYRRYNRKRGYADDILDVRAPNHLPIPDVARPIFPAATGG